MSDLSLFEILTTGADAARFGRRVSALLAPCRRPSGAVSALFQAAPIGPNPPALHPAVRQFTTLERHRHHGDATNSVPTVIDSTMHVSTIRHVTTLGSFPAVPAVETLYRHPILRGLLACLNHPIHRSAQSLPAFPTPGY